METKEDAECFVWRNAEEKNVGLIWSFHRSRACKPILETILQDRHHGSSKKRKADEPEPGWLPPSDSGSMGDSLLAKGLGWPWPGCGIFVRSEAIPELVSLMMLWFESPRGRLLHSQLVNWINAVYKAVGIEREAVGWLEELQSVQKGLRSPSYDLVFSKYAALWSFAAGKVLGTWGRQFVIISCFYCGACMGDPLPTLTPRNLRKMQSKAQRGMYWMTPTYRDPKPAVSLNDLVLTMVKDLTHSGDADEKLEGGATAVVVNHDELAKSIVGFMPEDPRDLRPLIPTVLKDATAEVCNMFHTWMIIPSTQELHERLVKAVNQEYASRGIKGIVSGGCFLKEIEKILCSIGLACCNGTNLEGPKNRLMACADAASSVFETWPGLEFIELCKFYLLMSKVRPLTSDESRAKVELSRGMIHASWGWYGSKVVDKAGDVQEEVNLNDPIGRVTSDLRRAMGGFDL